MRHAPKFTDTHKYTHPYRASHDTDVLRTIRRRQAELKAEAEAQALKDQETLTEQARKVKPLKASKS